MSLWMVVLGAVIGCWSSSTSEPDLSERPAASARAKAKGKGKGRKGKGRKGKAQMAPIGAAGDIMGELVLTSEVEPGRNGSAPKPEGTDAAADGTPAPEEGTPAPEGEAEGTPMVTRTKAQLKLTWGTDGSETVNLGRVRGECTEAEVRPVGPAGREKTPLWAVQCIDGDRTIDLFVLQVGSRISVLREMPGATPDAPKVVKPVKRIPLVQGATLKRAS